VFRIRFRIVIGALVRRPQRNSRITNGNIEKEPIPSENGINQLGSKSATHAGNVVKAEKQAMSRLQDKEDKIG
jgi:hypothetical protein